MKILFIANDFPNPTRPTRGVFNHQLVRALAAENNLRVIAPIPWTDELRDRPEDRRVWLDGVRVDHPRYYFPPKILRSHYGLFYWLSARRAIKLSIQELRPDVVLSYWVHPDGEVAIKAARRADVPSAVIVGGSDVLLLTQNPARRRRVMGVLEKIDAVITVSDHLRQHVIDMGIDAKKIHVWRQGVNRAVFHPGDKAEARQRLGLRPDGRIIVWVGRMVPVKGLDVLIDSCAKLHAEGFRFSLCLVGDGPLRQWLRHRCATLGISQIVKFVGSRSYDQLGNWYRAADFTVLPSRSEGLPNVIRESLACGTPFVASDVGGIREMAAPPTGRLVPPENIDALAHAIKAALLEPPMPVSPAIPIESWEESARNMTGILSGLPRTAPPRASAAQPEPIAIPT